MDDKRDISIGERIISLRKERGYTREDLSNKAEISTKFLYEIEMNKKGFSASTLIRLAGALEVSADYIMTGHGERKCDRNILATLEQYQPKTLEAIGELLKITYEILVE